MLQNKGWPTKEVDKETRTTLLVPTSKGETGGVVTGDQKCTVKRIVRGYENAQDTQNVR